MLLSEELSAALDERVTGRSELRRAELAATLLKSLGRSIQLSKGELEPAHFKVASEAHRAGHALLNAYVKHHWPKGAPRMDVRASRIQKGSPGIRRLLAALMSALDKLGDPGDLGFDDVADVKVGKAAAVMFAANPRN